MSNRIHKLSELISNQIAAGEVVQRPASVAKELLENSVDAGATMLVLGITDGGRSLIQVIDDGCGMSYNDAVTAFERHATSKITDSNDLFALTTFGFRGEALPSIGSVAEVELRTRQESDELGTLVSIKGGEVIEHSQLSTTIGSQFAVRNLFYNVPARRKFLKKPEIETKHIVAEFKKLALFHNNISMILHSNDRCIYNLPSTNPRRRVADVVGERINKSLIDSNKYTTS